MHSHLAQSEEAVSFIFQSAGIGGCAHLVNFLGTDTLGGVMTARRYYGENMAGVSIPAAEHRYCISTIMLYAVMMRQCHIGLPTNICASF